MAPPLVYLTLSLVFLRLASFLLLVVAIGHTYGLLYPADLGADAEQALEGIKKVRFEFFGTNRSHWEFYHGCSMLFTVNANCLAILIFILSGQVKSRISGLLPCRGVVFLDTAGIAVLS
eukprot:EC119065.1.p1 GENE.EC119065.1~~EC119065.1.p1  ORF type:complete len:119 (+),score=7.96 EC119065.1:72-428(+)